MKMTNKLNLPDQFLSKEDHEYKENRYSVTELLLSTREILLNRKYSKYIEVDVSDSIPALIGTGVHKVLEDNTADAPGILTEYDVESKFGDYVVAGRIDLLNLDNDDSSIEDYKTCSVSKVVKQDFDDWYKQGMMYALLMFKKQGILIRHLKFYAIMKDWSKIKASTSANYPQSAVYIWKFDIRDSDYDYIEKYINDKLKSIHSGILPKCTDEERWYTGTKYAVYKKAGDKKAAIVCDSEEEAHSYITNKCDGAGQIEVRKGEYLKCKYYCNCHKFCEAEDKE